MEYDPEQLAEFLIKSGFSRTGAAISSGAFSVRGEIVDLVMGEDQGYRINFGWNIIESIKEFDINNQISTKNIPKLTLSLANETLLNTETITNFKNNFLKIFGVNHINNPLYSSLISGQKFQGYEHLMPLFYKKLYSLQNYLGEHIVIYDHLSIQAMLEHEKSYNDFYHARLLSNKANHIRYYYAIPPEILIFNTQIIKELLSKNENILIESGTDFGCKTIKKTGIIASNESKTNFKKLFELIINNKTKISIILCQSKSSMERIKLLVRHYEYLDNYIKSLKEARSNFINLAIAPLSQGFITQKYLFISEQDIFGSKFSSQSHKASKKRLKNILTELDNINENELIVHKKYGIGRFERIETIIVDGIAHGCLKIIYAD